MQTLKTAPVANALDLLKFLTALQADGEDLANVYVLDKDGNDAHIAVLQETFLTDGSKVHDVRVWFDGN